MKKYLLIVLVPVMVLMGCTDFDKLNQDPKGFPTTKGEYLFTHALYQYFYMKSDCNVNRNNFRLFAQYWAQTTYPQESQFNITSREVPFNFSSGLYRQVLNDLKLAEKEISALTASSLETALPVLNNKLAIIKILRAMTYHLLVDTYGNIPYTEALNADNPAPKYDDARTIYDDLEVKLSEAIATLKANKSVNSFTADEEPVYKGDVSKWIALANSVRLRLGMRLADVDEAKAKSIVESAYTDAISSSSGDFKFLFTEKSPYYNPLYENIVASGRSDYVAANTIVDIMNKLEDPRRKFYFQDHNGDGDNNPETGTSYIGGEYGNNNTFSAFSKLSALYHKGDYPGNLMSYVEVEFLLAEAAQRGYSVGALTAKNHYNRAVTASIVDWGGTEADALSYLEKPDVTYDATNWKNSIGTQMWIAMFFDGFEGWTTWRRLDVPTLNVPTDKTYSDIPKRLPYPARESSLNGTNYKAAGVAIGGDKITTKLFWDVN